MQRYNYIDKSMIIYWNFFYSQAASIVDEMRFQINIVIKKQ